MTRLVDTCSQRLCKLNFLVVRVTFVSDPSKTVLVTMFQKMPFNAIGTVSMKNGISLEWRQESHQLGTLKQNHQHA